MPAHLPYLPSAGTVETALKRINEAARPERFTTDFVKTVLQIRGGAGGGVPPFFKRLGFLNTDGTPTALYDKYRNASTSRYAVGDAIRHGYKALYQGNEYAHSLNDADLKGLILQVSGLEQGSVARQIFTTFKKLRGLAEFDETPVTEETSKPPAGIDGAPPPRAKGLSLAYTINLNLPPSTNPEVFNAIFKSLREHLLND